MNPTTASTLNRGMESDLISQNNSSPVGSSSEHGSSSSCPEYVARIDDTDHHMPDPENTRSDGAHILSQGENVFIVCHRVVGTWSRHDMHRTFYSDLVNTSVAGISGVFTQHSARGGGGVWVLILRVVGYSYRCISLFGFGGL